MIVGVNHKPLLGVLNDKTLDSIDNPRLMKLKEKTDGWLFQIIHIPGRKLGAPVTINSITLEEDDETSTCKEVRQAFFGYIWYFSSPDYDLNLSCLGM